MKTAPMKNDVPPQLPEAPSVDAILLVRGLAGAIVGGLVGYFLFRWLYVQGFYALMLPGVLIGLGAGLAARGRSHLLGVLCAAAALLLGVYAEWSVAPFKQDQSLLFFVTHLHQLDGAGLKLLMLALGTACGYWFGKGR